jgi:hypothetical protein
VTKTQRAIVQPNLTSSIVKFFSNWNLSSTEVISLVLGIFAFIISLPNAIVFFVGYFYNAKIEAFFPPSFRYEKGSKIIWSNLNNSYIQVRNNKPKNFHIEIEIITEKAWQPETPNWFPHSRLKGGYPLRGGIWYRTESHDLPGNSQSAIKFPLTPKQENNTLEIIIHIKMRLSEFKFPAFYGEITLNPIKEKFTRTDKEV